MAAPAARELGLPVENAMMEFEQLGPYQIVRRLGRGGMGTVYEALHIETDERAAVKLLAAPLANEEAFRERFQGEIETLKKLNHPNIVRLFGFGRQQQRLFYAMELVDGDSLEHELEQGRRFDWREVTQIGIDVARALRHAHDRGVIHRDIKPGNLLLAREGQTKLSDFGIARMFGNTGLTNVGSVLGTAEYMAPEQAEGRPVTPRSDLYSLGVVLYVLLTGRPLFRGDSLPEILHKQRFEKPEPVGAHAPDVPATFGQIVAQLLEKDPDRRIPNATLLIRQLEAMQRALSLRPEDEHEFVVRNEPGAVATDPDDHAWQEYDGMRTTRVATDVPREPSSQPRPKGPPDALAETKLTTHVSSSPSDASPADAQAQAEPAGDSATAEIPTTPENPSEDEAQDSAHFTPVAPEELDQPEARRERPALISLHTWFLLAGLVAVGLSVWYFLQPPSADALHARIAAQTEDGSIEALRQAEADIRRFLNLYSEDPRSDELLDYVKEIELDRLERRFQLRAKGLAGSETLVPVERAYLEAISYLRIDPERGMAKLQALIDLYDHRTDVSGPTGQCLELARRRLDQLREEIDRETDQQLSVLKDRLDEARRLGAQDPDRARAIFLAILELYQGKPWAAEMVGQARDGLDTLNAGGSAPAADLLDGSPVAVP